MSDVLVTRTSVLLEKGLRKSHQIIFMENLDWEVRLRMCVLWKRFYGGRELTSEERI